MSTRTDNIYKPILANKKIPILTLDNKWHKLFTQTEPNKRLKRREEELNALIKKQGKANTEIKEIKKLKRKLMQGIMENAGEATSGHDGRARKKTDESKRLLVECNEKIAGYENELLELPGEIDKVNKELMLTTMEICYDRLKENKREIEEITKWAEKVKEELKQKLIIKQEKEDANQEIYSYMHDIFGRDVIDLFDMKYKKNEMENESQ